MNKPLKLYTATDANLTQHGLAPAMRWLIATALAGATVTYGEIKRRLEEEASFSTIFATRIGFVAGELMDAIQRAEADAPLINVLVVNQQDQLPSRGAGPFMAKRFARPKLGEPSSKARAPSEWKVYFEKAAAEVYAYPPEEWARLYELTFGHPLSLGEVNANRERRQDGNENDIGAGAGKYGSGGEGEHHKALRLWVTAHPEFINRAYAGARTETEFELDSGDRVDAVYHLADRTVVVEVKSRISNAVDFRRGVFQCIKYRAVKAAMDVREEAHVEAVLVTETKLPGEISALLKRHRILHRQAPPQRS